MTLQIHLFIRYHCDNEILVAHDWFSFSSDFIERNGKYKQI